MITVKLWKEVSEFNPMENGELNVDKTVKLISQVKEIPVEEVEKMDISDLLPEFLDCVRIINTKIFAKVDKMPKNGSGDGQ